MDILKSLKSYDRLLYIKNYLNGRKEIRRQSPFKHHTSYSIINIRNKFIGSGNWIKKMLYKQDAQRTRVIYNRAEHNKGWSKKDIEKNKIIAKELAEFITNNEKI